MMMMMTMMTMMMMMMVMMMMTNWPHSTSFCHLGDDDDDDNDNDDGNDDDHLAPLPLIPFVRHFFSEASLAPNASFHKKSSLSSSLYL